jgi:hypothetical protein
MRERGGGREVEKGKERKRGESDEGEWGVGG